MTARCRSCDAPIEWAITVKGSRIPLDPGEDDGGNIIVDVDGIAHVVGPGDNGRVPRRRSHFATCPNAAQHRKGRR